MRNFKPACFAVVIAISSFVLGQETNRPKDNSTSEKELWDVENAAAAE